jgi:hypothetical protein
VVIGNTERLHAKAIELMCVGEYGPTYVSFPNDRSNARQRYIETGWFW